MLENCSQTPLGRSCFSLLFMTLSNDNLKLIATLCSDQKYKFCASTRSLAEIRLDGGILRNCIEEELRVWILF